MQLDPQLEKDCYQLGTLSSNLLLLFDNALVPWFILVPEGSAVELHQLEPTRQMALLEAINLLSKFIQSKYSVDKLNVAALGNKVQQLHIHVIGRYKTDPRWPEPIWGITEKQPYTKNEIDEMLQQLRQTIPNRFRPAGA